jgi:hypothetical protein
MLVCTDAFQAVNLFIQLSLHLGKKHTITTSPILWERTKGHAIRYMRLQNGNVAEIEDKFRHHVEFGCPF